MSDTESDSTADTATTGWGGEELGTPWWAAQKVPSVLPQDLPNELEPPVRLDLKIQGNGSVVLFLMYSPR